MLSVYRPDVGLERDPIIAEAIEQLFRDSELARWFAEQLEFDETIVQLLQERRPPEELKARTLALLRSTRRLTPQRRTCTIRSLFIGLLIALGAGLLLGWLIAR